MSFQTEKYIFTSHKIFTLLHSMDELRKQSAKDHEGSNYFLNQKEYKC